MLVPGALVDREHRIGGRGKRVVGVLRSVERHQDALDHGANPAAGVEPRGPRGAQVSGPNPGPRDPWCSPSAILLDGCVGRDVEARRRIWGRHAEPRVRVAVGGAGRAALRGKPRHREPGGTSTTFGGGSLNPVISGDGRFVAFESHDATLVPGDTNGFKDIFVYDRESGAIARVSVATDGAQANSESQQPGISRDGRWVAFHSFASNLVPGDTNGVYDTFLHDRQTGITTRVSVASGGAESAGAIERFVHPHLSADGRYVAFVSSASDLAPGDVNTVDDVFLHDRMASTTEIVSVDSNGSSVTGPVVGGISDDGRWVAFSSFLDTVVPDDTNQDLDVFLRDRVAGTTTRVNVSTAGFQSPNGSFAGSRTTSGLSADGRFVLFTSWASNLAPDDDGSQDVFVHDRDGALACGDGTVQAGEECDDGNALPGDGCEPGCVAADCAAGTTVVGARLGLRRLGLPVGDEGVTLRGALVFSPGSPSGFDPERNGAQVLVVDLGADGRRVVDFTWRTIPAVGDIEATVGRCDFGCGRWTVNAGRTSFKFDPRNLAWAAADPTRPLFVVPYDNGFRKLTGRQPHRARNRQVPVRGPQRPARRTGRSVPDHLRHRSARLPRRRCLWQPVVRRAGVRARPERQIDPLSLACAARVSRKRRSSVV